MTWAILLLGCSGLVTEVGLENDGLVRSTRLLAGATGRHPLPLSGRMQAGPGGIIAGAVDLRGLEDDPDPHALATSATARPRPSRIAPRRRLRHRDRRGLARWLGISSSCRRNPRAAAGWTARGSRA